MHAGSIHLGVGAQNVCLGSVRDGDDGIGVEDRRALHPGTHRIAGAKLLGLPRAQRFQAVSGQHKGDAIELFGEEAGHRRIPGVRVDDVDLRELLHLHEVQCQRIDGGLELGGWPGVDAVGNPGRRHIAAHMQVVLVEPLRAPAVDFDLDQTGKLAAQVLHVHARSAIDFGRILPCDQANPHRDLHSLKSRFPRNRIRLERSIPMDYRDSTEERPTVAAHSILRVNAPRQPIRDKTPCNRE